MNCADLPRLLHAYADRELDLVRSLEVERHLQNCQTCAARLTVLQSLSAALRAAPLSYAAPESLRERLQEMTAENTPAPQRPHPGQSRARWFWQLLAGGAVATALLIVVLRPAGISPGDQLTNELVAGHVRSLMASHLTDVLSSDQHTVKPWFNGRLDFAPAVKDFAADGFPLVGGRLDYIQGRPVAALVYRRSQHVINVFIWPAGKTAPAKGIAANRDGFNLVNREFDGLHCCLVSDLNEAELTALADLIVK